jgi:predicted nucleic acid-binding protein
VVAELKLQLKRQGTPIPINDVWIAALVLQHRATLFTRASDFTQLPQLPRV